VRLARYSALWSWAMRRTLLNRSSVILGLDLRVQGSAGVKLRMSL
jgi:hypothetical protein